MSASGWPWWLARRRLGARFTRPIARSHFHYTYRSPKAATLRAGADHRSRTPDLILRLLTWRFSQPWHRDKFWAVWYRDSIVGAVIATFGASDNPVRWAWTTHLHPSRFGHGNPAPLYATAADREAALVALHASFERTLAHVGEDRWQHHLVHMERIGARGGEPA